MYTYYYMAICRKKQGNVVYLQEYKNVRVDGKVKHIFVRHMGVEGKDEKPIKKAMHTIDKIGFSNTQFYGATSVLWNICKELRLEEIINENTHSNSDFSVGKLLLAVAINKIINPLKIRKIQNWIKRTNLPKLMNYEENEFARHNIYRALDVICYIKDGVEYEYSQKIEKAIFETQTIFPKKIFSSIIYDTTPTFYYGETCELAKVGYNSKKIREKQIKVALCVTKEYHMPIFHFTMKGSTMDALTSTKTSQLISDFNIKNPLVMWDKAITTLETIRWAEENNVHLLVGLSSKFNEAKYLFQEKIEETPENFIIDSDEGAIYGIIKEFKFFKKNVNVIVYVNTKRAMKSRTERHKRITETIESLKKLDEKDINIKHNIKETIKGLEEFIIIKQTNKTYSYEINKKKVEESEKIDAKSVILCTDKDYTKKEVIMTYFGKNEVERAFRVLKDTLEMDKINHRLPTRVKAYFFVCYLSYLLYSVLEYKLRIAGIQESVEDIVDKLHHVEKLNLKYGQQNKDVLLNLGTEEREILKKLKMNDLILSDSIERPIL